MKHYLDGMERIHNKYQFVSFYPKWLGIGFRKIKSKEGLYLIYDWFIWFGYWVIRKLIPISEEKKRLEEYKNARTLP